MEWNDITLVSRRHNADQIWASADKPEIKRGSAKDDDKEYVSCGHTGQRKLSHTYTQHIYYLCTLIVATSSCIIMEPGALAYITYNSYFDRGESVVLKVLKVPEVPGQYFNSARNQIRSVLMDIKIIKFKGSALTVQILVKVGCNN